MAPEDKAKEPKIEKSYCRQCGGERNHFIRAAVEKNYEDDHTWGGGSWSILECCGCETITFEHKRWFSEDSEYNEDTQSLELNIHKETYPPHSRRKKPEWGISTIMSFPVDDLWLFSLHGDIYKTIGLGSFMLAAMGTRTLIDYVVTLKAELGNNAPFAKKLAKLLASGVLTQTQFDVIQAAFDAGSAASHRGYEPSEEDVFTLLNIAENLIQKFCVAPILEKHQIEKAKLLKAKIPPRNQ